MAEQDKTTGSQSGDAQQSPPQHRPITLSLLRETINESLDEHMERLEERQEKMGGLFHRHPSGGGGQRISAIAMRLGINAAIRSGQITDASEINALKFAATNADVQTIIATNPKAPFAADPGTDPTRDWTGFFSAFGNFLVQIMPLIMQIVQALGGLSTHAAAAFNAQSQNGQMGLPTVPAWMYVALEQLSYQALVNLAKFLQDYLADNPAPAAA